jgi:hypothetical protein
MILEFFVPILFVIAYFSETVETLPINETNGHSTGKKSAKKKDLKLNLCFFAVSLKFSLIIFFEACSTLT